MQPKTIEKQLKRILLKVTKPGRYVGGEFNSIVKDWDSTDFKVVLAFPDIYDLGMSNLGIMILYEQINKQPDMLAERTYSPWTDMETVMRRDSTCYGLQALTKRQCWCWRWMMWMHPCVPQKL